MLRAAAFASAESAVTESCRACNRCSSTPDGANMSSGAIVARHLAKRVHEPVRGVARRADRKERDYVEQIGELHLDVVTPP